jgi:hypothetical protein
MEVEIRSNQVAERIARIKRAMETYQIAPYIGSISAMPVLIEYETEWREYRHFKRGDEHVFDSTIPASEEYDPDFATQMKSSFLNAHAILDDFQKAKTPLEVLDFLNKTGQFSLMDLRVTWSYFKRWQRFAYLVQEHDLLAVEMKRGSCSGELGEVLKCLSGDTMSTFFDGTELQPTAEHAERIAQWRLDPKFVESVREGRRIESEERAKLCSWFRQPPDDAHSIEWIPKNAEDNVIVDPLVDNGAMIEFLLPRDAMRPVLFITARSTLEAIAAAIYADRIEGIEYRACEVCSDLFEVGTRGEKKYCSRERCKNTAHQRRMRANRAKAKKRESEMTESEEQK